MRLMLYIEPNNFQLVKVCDVDEFLKLIKQVIYLIQLTMLEYIDSLCLIDQVKM